MIQKEAVTKKLFDAIHELKQRSRDSKLSEIQRMYGVVLGLRIALMELNMLEGVNPYTFAGHLGIQSLMLDSFGQKTLKEIRDYAFPDFKT